MFWSATHYSGSTLQTYKWRATLLYKACRSFVYSVIQHFPPGYYKERTENRRYWLASCRFYLNGHRKCQRDSNIRL